MSPDRKSEIQDIIRSKHYTRSVPSGKSLYYEFEGAFVVFSIPANKNISRWLLGVDNAVWELSRLWAPDGHDPNLLTRAISAAISAFKRENPKVRALVSYADPNAGHRGGVYRAASWIFAGQCEENRAYRDADGRIFSRRAFHSGRKSLKKAEILAKGYVEHKLPGKLRFVRPLDHRTRKHLARRF